ncbi:hypothetical protein LUZ61_004742 [Rhynchospora tenuis]|uniref:KIB1-4 beta-propeller domain-containing protein n=1 Tax=Rhynchospora tenuis TaxID=198213 RepID=A0AAD6ETV8_9POAL|nr:hypothetical protein LUZ61_004742 [Rhynchospora tenuis]
MIPDWAYIPPEIVHLISQKVKSITDYVRFRAVCSPWRSASLPKPHNLPPQLPWLMIPYYPHKKFVSEDRFFFDLWEGKMRKLHLPETRDMLCCASYRGWLLLAAHPNGTEVCLLNPLTRARIQLPPFTASVKHFGDDPDNFFVRVNFVSYMDGIEVGKVSFSTDLTDPNCLIMLNCKITVFNMKCGVIFVCRVGDPCWTSVNSSLNSSLEFPDAMYHNGRFYLLYKEGIAIIEPNKPVQKFVYYFEPELKALHKYFLKGKSGIHIVVVHPAQNEDDPSAHDTKEAIKKIHEKFWLYQFLDQQGELKLISNTSNTAIFLDMSLFLAVCSSDWDSLNEGSIYYMYSEKHPTGACYTVYSAKWDEGKFEPVVHDFGKELLIRPHEVAMWFQPSLV